MKIVINMYLNVNRFEKLSDLLWKINLTRIFFNKVTLQFYEWPRGYQFPVFRADESLRTKQMVKFDKHCGTKPQKKNML